MLRFWLICRTLVCEVSSAVPDNDEAQMEMDIDGQRNEDSTDSKQFTVGNLKLVLSKEGSVWATLCKQI